MAFMIRVPRSPCLSQVTISTVSHFLNLRREVVQIYKIHGKVPGVIMDIETVLIDLVLQCSDSSRVTSNDFVELVRLYAELDESCGKSRMYVASVNSHRHIVQKLRVPRESMMSMLEECSKTCCDDCV